MYALVALGGVLTGKAWFLNFAQGDLVMFAGYAAAVMLGLRGLPLWLMVLILCIGMIALGFVLERGILRPMIGQPLVSVIMVTIGLSFVLQGLVAIIWGAGTRKLELPVRRAPYVIGPVFISSIVVAGVIASSS
jgi:branched-chain amino acid transport system permease protein